jgi:molybdopterin/thiamine biosynthesis adenylyltransferase/proteasome lid subunit RPN8/RPN11
MWRVLDAVLREIAEAILSQPPERGGALLGPPGRPLVTRFVFDEWATPHSVTYQPSEALREVVQRIELHEDLELKGLVHSHPGNLRRPSEADHRELEEALRRNPHLSVYLAPLVVAGGAPEAPHELSIGGRGVMAWFAAYRVPGGRARVAPVRAQPLPIQRDLEAVREALGGREPPQIFPLRDGEEGLLAGRLLLPGGTELLFLFGEGYPMMPPILLITPPGGATEQVALNWSLECAAEERLREAVRERLWPPGPYRPAFGSPGGVALTTDPARARQAGWVRVWTGQDPKAIIWKAQEELRSRLPKGMEWLGRRVLIAGLGSVGSYLAEQLARSGVGGLILIDPERVEWANLSRTVYEADDVGQLKVEALARRLLRIRPDLAVTPIPRALQDLGPEILERMITAIDLVIGATDDPKAQLRLNHWAYARGKPALFVGLYAGAEGGEVILTIPERTPCYRCATRLREAAGDRLPGMDYDTGRLSGEPALVADIHHVASAAAKLALAMLVGVRASGLGAILKRPLQEGMTYVTFGMVPGYWFYPRIFEGVAGQHAFQTVWLTPERDPHCPVCGDPAARVDPREIPTRSPTLARLRGVSNGPSKSGEPPKDNPSP